MDIEKQSNLVDARIAGWMARYGILLTRIALGIVFFWFGVLKFFPGLAWRKTFPVAPSLR